MRLFRRSRALLAVAAFVALATLISRADDQKHHRPPSHHSSHHSRPSRHSRHVMRNGNSIERRNGRVRSVHDERRHMDIEHQLNGGRRISVERADHSRIVAEHRRGAYVEHPYAFHGHDYYHRTFYRSGRVVGWHLYRGYSYHGYRLHVWVPRYYYHPAFYGWAYHPWRARVYYGWPWVHWPWYGYYGYYFQPYPYYDDGSEWLTDYTLSNDLHAEYLADNPGGGASQPPADAGEDQPPAAMNPEQPSTPGAARAPMLSPEVKAEVDKEIQYELQVEAGEAALNAADQDAGNSAPDGIARLFADKDPHVFVVADPVDVEDETTGDECSLSNGDILRTTAPPGPDDKAASLTVIAAKGQPRECATSSTVSVNLDELQEMQNSLDEAIQNGMEKLQQKQGTDGLPALPADAQGTTTPPYAQDAPPPDATAGPDIQQQIRDATQSEQEVTTEETQEPDTTSPAAAPQSATQPPPATQAPAPIERRPPE